MLRILFLVFAGITAGAFLILLLLPFLVLIFIVKLLTGRTPGRVFVWRAGVPKQHSPFAGSEYSRAEKFSDSVYDVKAEVIKTEPREERVRQLKD